MNIYDRPTPKTDALFPIGPFGVPETRTNITKIAADFRRLEQERNALMEAFRKARDELGVPQPEYPQPVANAVEIINEVLRAIKERK